MSDLSLRKARIREAMLARRGRLALPAQEEASRRILKFLQEKLPWARWDRVALYRAMAGEIFTAGLEPWLRSQGKRLFFPRTHRQDWTIEMVEMGPRESWVMSPIGTQEPAAEKSPTTPAQLDVALLPGVAFDRSGRRLGRGKGCYDRWLKDFTGVRVGLAHSFQFLDEIPADVLDQGVDFVVTPEEFWQVSK